MAKSFVEAARKLSIFINIMAAISGVLSNFKAAVAGIAAGQVKYPEPICS